MRTYGLDIWCFRFAFATKIKDWSIGFKIFWIDYANIDILPISISVYFVRRLWSSKPNLWNVPDWERLSELSSENVPDSEEEI